MVQYGFYYDNSRCTGCKTCVMACKDYKDSALDVAYRKVYDLEGGTWEKQADDIYTTDCLFYHLSMACNHCDDPACVSVCPTTAMHKEGKRGLVLVDETKCVGCGYCVMACPYNAPKVSRELGYSVKCNGCEADMRHVVSVACARLWSDRRATQEVWRHGRDPSDAFGVLHAPQHHDKAFASSARSCGIEGACC